MTHPVWPLSPEHPYYLSREERYLLGGYALDHHRVVEARAALVEAGLLRPQIHAGSGPAYVITDTGRQVLELYRLMEEE